MSNIIYAYSYEFGGPVGRLGIAEADGAICRVLFDCALDDLRGACGAGDGGGERLLAGANACSSTLIEICETDLLRCAAAQIAEYLSGARAAFDIPLLLPDGPGFTKSVYAELLKIPAGQTRSYKEVAAAAGNPKAHRAVGMVNNKNRIPIFVPCHRVIGSNGTLVGYAGGLPLKKFLIETEKTHYA